MFFRKKIYAVLFICIFFVGCSRLQQTTVTPVGEEFIEPSREEVDKKLSYLQQFPIEYQRLTIPYLRRQTFSGSQIKIGRHISESSTHTSSLASYQSEGLQINGLLTRPKSEAPEGGYPAVVFLHGYIPPNEYRTTENYVNYAEALAREGLVVFKIDLRGHDQSEGEPNGAYFSGDYIFDTLNARASLQKLDYVNPEKVGLWGHSMSGNLVARAMAVKPEIPVGVIWAGAVYTYSDMQEYSIQDSSYDPSQNPSRNRRQELYDLVGEVSDDNMYWQSVSPVAFLPDFQGKLEIHHAVNDTVVNIGYSRNLVEFLETVGTDHQLYEYASGGHNLTAPSFTTAMSRSAQVFKEL